MLDLKYPKGQGIRYLGMLYTPERLAFLITSGYANNVDNSTITPYKIAISLRSLIIVGTASRDSFSIEFMVDDQIDVLMHPNKKLQALKALRGLYAK